jgi:hypothetical protein
MSYAPTGAVVGRAQDLARALLAVWHAFWISQESATVVVDDDDDVVLVLARPANSSIGDGEHVIVVHIVVPRLNVSGALEVWCAGYRPHVH